MPHIPPTTGGWGRVQVAPVTPYTPETTIPLPGVTAATRAQRQHKLLQRATVEATQCVPCQEPGRASALGTGFPGSAKCWHGCCRALCEQAASSLLPLPLSLSPPGSTPQQGQCRPLHQDSFTEVPPGTGTPGRDSSVTPYGHGSCLDLSLGIPVSVLCQRECPG